MITTILEVLVAVVVLIVIIAVAALHFLRADDSDTFDDMPEEPRKTRRHPGHPADDPGPAERRVRRPEPGVQRRVPDDRDARQPGYGKPGQGSQRPVPVGARPANAARAADPDPATGWESLSDVDYWAELASDKPVPPADVQGAPNPAKRGRRGIEPKADAPRAADLSAVRADSGQPPARQRPQSRPGAGPYGAEPATQNLAALARLGDQQAPSQQPPSQQPPSQQRALPSRGGSPSRPLPAQRTGPGQPAVPPNGQRPGRQAIGQRPATGPRPGGASRAPRALPPALPQSGQGSHTGARPPLPMDDDPLTSPSFPAINASDSRSYRTRSRSGAPSSQQHSSQQHSSQQHSSQPSGSHAAGSPGTNPGYGEPARQAPDYPGQTSSPNGYPVQPAAASAAHLPAHSAAPAANPYGSYVSPPRPSYPEPANGHLDAAAYGTGYAAGQQAAAAANWYAGTDTNQANGYLPGNGDSAGTGYSAADYGAGYPGYQGAQPALPAGGYGQHGHQGGYDQRGYQGPDASYGQDGYEAYPGYGGAAR